MLSALIIRVSLTSHHAHLQDESASLHTRPRVRVRARGAGGRSEGPRVGRAAPGIDQPAERDGAAAHHHPPGALEVSDCDVGGARIRDAVVSSGEEVVSWTFSCLFMDLSLRCLI